jgi:hypothetical protein
MATTNLATFCVKFQVYKKGEHRNKIYRRPRSSKEVVIQFHPSRLSALPNSPSYTEYCRYSLMKYKPYVDHPKNTYGGVEDVPTEEDAPTIKTVWENFLLQDGNDFVPEWFFRELDNLQAEQHHQLFHRLQAHPDALAANAHQFNPPDDGILQPNPDDNDDVDWTTAAANNLQLPKAPDEDSDPHEMIQWATTNDWRAPTHLFNDMSAPVEDVRAHLQLQTLSDQPYERPVVLFEDLNEQQKLAFKMAVEVCGYEPGESITDGGTGLSRLMMMLGRGGTGKSFTIDAIVNAVGADRVSIMATTGKAASLIGGCTLHNKEFGLSLPVNKKFAPLQGNAEKHLQETFRNIDMVIIDEFSMLRSKEGFYASERLKQAKGRNSIFGGVAVMVVGDPGQLPAVQGYCLWDDVVKMSGSPDDVAGSALYHQFLSVIELTINRRVNGAGDKAKQFCDLQGRVRDAEVTEDDWNVLKTRSRDSLGHDEWIQQGFSDDNVTHLCVTNAEVDKRNLRCIMKLDTPVCKIEAKHTGSWNRVSSDNFQGLEPTLYLAEGARVMFTNNTLHKLNITNGTTGTVKFIKFADSDLNLDGTLKSPCLPEYVWVDFGDEYRGITFFPNNPSRRGWVPVYPVTARYWSSSTSETTRTMIPLKLAWGWTIHKSQGQTFIGKFVINLGNKEIAPGLTYVAISRATSLENIGFAGGLPLDRVTTKLMSARIEQRKKEEIRLRELQEATINSLNRTNP